EIGADTEIPQVLRALGEAALAGRDRAAARSRFRESLALCREFGNTWGSASALLGEGHVAVAERDASAANHSYIEALEFFAGLPSGAERRQRTGVAACLSGLASAAARAAPERAAWLWGIAEALRERVGRAALAQFDIAFPLPSNRTAEDLALAAVRVQLAELT